MGDEQRREWVCTDCAVRVFNASDELIPEPRKWADGRCPRCRVEHARATEGKEASDKLYEQLMRRSRRRPAMERKSAGEKKRRAAAGERREAVRATCEAHPNWNGDQISEATGIPSRTVARIRGELGLARVRLPKGITPEMRESIEAALRSEPKPDAAIAKELSVDYGAVSTTRHAMGLPTAKERRRTERQQRIRELLAEHPEWTNDQLADAMDEYRSTVMRDRKELGLSRKTLVTQTAS